MRVFCGRIVSAGYPSLLFYPQKADILSISVDIINFFTIIMQERNVLAGATATVISPLVDFYGKLLPFLILAVILIAIDSRFGIQASRKRGETIRTSRAVRRAINKLVDYICWITLAGMLGQTFGVVFHIPLLSMIVLLVVYTIELSSIFNNYFFYKGLKFKFDGLKFISKIVKTDVEQIITKEDEDTNR